MITFFGPPPNFLDFQQAICYYKSEKWHERHLIAPARMLPANIRLTLSSITHLYNGIFLLNIEDVKKFTRAISYPTIFLFTIPSSILFPKSMCELLGFFPQQIPTNKIYHYDKTPTPVE